MKINIYNGWKLFRKDIFDLEIINLQIEIYKNSGYLYFTILNFDVIIKLYNNLKED